MDCLYYKKANFWKRMFGVIGYCTRHQVSIRKHRKMSYYPYVCCWDKENNSIRDCEVELKFTDEKKQR